MSAFGSRKSQKLFMRVSESECVKPEMRDCRLERRWSRRLRLGQLEDPKSAKNSTSSFIERFHHSFNIKFTILSLILLVFFMPGSAVAALVDSGSSTDSSGASTSESADIIVQSSASVPNPTLFDTISISSNSTTTTCPEFFATFLQDPNFLNCLPLSALLLNSQSYFEITMKGAFPMTQIIDKTCNVDVDTCQGIMDKLSRQITMEANCGADFRLGNPIVNQAYAAFIAYKPIYTAGCLKSDSGSYCYVDAMTNLTSPSDSYVYYLPVGRTLPGGARPTCSTCLQSTMAVFSVFAANSTQPLSTTFIPAAEQMDVGCGPDFIGTSIEMFSGDTSKTFLPIKLLLSTTLLVVTAIIAT